MFNHSELIAFAVALLASLGLTVPIRQLALRYGMVDKPGPRKVHLNPIPLLGGIAIYLGYGRRHSVLARREARYSEKDATLDPV